MAVREFTDSGGREWRVWDVMPESIHPQTKTEDYLAAMYQTGWLVFETKAEDEKRRLSDIPPRWSSLPDEELEALLRRAEVTPPRKLRSRVPVKERPDVTDLGVVRTFRYPGGRNWTVSVIRQPERGGPPVMRFASGTRHFDLGGWPKDWADFRDSQLVDLLRQAAPRRPAPAPPPGTPRRRWDDFQV